MHTAAHAPRYQAWKKQSRIPNSLWLLNRSHVSPEIACVSGVKCNFSRLPQRSRTQGTGGKDQSELARRDA